MLQREQGFLKNGRLSGGTDWGNLLTYDGPLRYHSLMFRSLSACFCVRLISGSLIDAARGDDYSCLYVKNGRT